MGWFVGYKYSSVHWETSGGYKFSNLFRLRKNVATNLTSLSYIVSCIVHHLSSLCTWTISTTRHCLIMLQASRQLTNSFGLKTQHASTLSIFSSVACFEIFNFDPDCRKLTQDLKIPVILFYFSANFRMSRRKDLWNLIFQSMFWVLDHVLVIKV